MKNALMAKCRSGVRVVRWVALGLITVSGSLASPAGEDPYLLDAAVAAGGKEFSLTVPTNGLVQLGLVKLAPTNTVTSVTLQVGLFRAEPDGRALDVALAGTNVSFGPNQALQGIILRVPPFPAAAKYKGT